MIAAAAAAVVVAALEFFLRIPVGQQSRTVT